MPTFSIIISVLGFLYFFFNWKPILVRTRLKFNRLNFVKFLKSYRKTDWFALIIIFIIAISIIGKMQGWLFN